MNKIWIAVPGVALAAGLGLWLSTTSDDPATPPDPAAAEAAAKPAAAAAGKAVAASSARPGSQAAAAERDGGDPAATDGDAVDEDAVDQAGIKLTTMNAVRGLDRPARKLGEPATAAAMEEPDMSEFEVTDPDYDEVVEAHQLFHDFETDILSRGQITPAVWAELIEAHAPAKEEMLERSVVLARAGEADKSESLLLEWNALEAGYQGQVE